jgi:serine/threonine-protein kinase
VDSDLELARARLGRTVGGRWLLERVLGTGGMGAVYAARGPDGRVAAVKILHPEMGARREVRERFLREGSAASKIGHPGVVQMLGEGDGDEAFLAMELLEGETLRDRVRRHGRLPLEEVLDYAAQVLEVLVAAHERGVVHRDLKPDNLFVTLDQRVKVLDFGLARLLDGMPGQNLTRTGVALGTLAYMAPEQALGRRGEIDGRTDLFALGATLFRVLSGRRVHEAESEAELLMAMASRPAPPLGAVAPDVPEAVSAVVDLALAFTRDARYPDARTMLGDLLAVRRGSAPPFATARLSARDERTRAEQPAAPQRVPIEQAAYSQRLRGDHAAHSQRTQPLGTVSPTSQRTIPLAAHSEPTALYPGAPPASSPHIMRDERAPPSAHAANPVSPSSRTEPLARVPRPVNAYAVNPHAATPKAATPGIPPTAPGVGFPAASAMVHPSGAPGPTVSMQSGPPNAWGASLAAGTPLIPRSPAPNVGAIVAGPAASARGRRVLMLVAGAVLAVVVLAVVYVVSSRTPPSAEPGANSVLPAPLRSAEPSVAAGVTAAPLAPAHRSGVPPSVAGESTAALGAASPAASTTTPVAPMPNASGADPVPSVEAGARNHSRHSHGHGPHG